MATYRRRPKKGPRGRWQATVRVARHESEYRTFDTKKEAKDWAIAREAELRNSAVQGTEQGRQALRAPFYALLNRYKDEILPEMRPLTQRVEGYRIKRLTRRSESGRLQYPIVGLLTSEITPSEVKKFIRQRLDDEHVKESTLKLDIARLGHCYTVAIRDWGMPAQTNPFYQPRIKRRRTDETPEEPKSDQERKPARISPAQERKILKAAKEGPHAEIFHPLVVAALHTGIRGIELLRLSWDELDFKAELIRLPGHKTKNGKPRVVPITPVVEKALKALPRDSDRVFSLTRNQISYAWQELKGKTGIETWFHDLRHEFISRARDAGIPNYLVQQIAGHGSMAMTDRYSHQDEELLREFAKPRLK